MPLNYMITAKWGKDTADWYIPLDITVKNNTTQDLNSPAISFDISKIQNITPGSEIRAYTGFAQQTFAPPVIKGNLSEHLSLLKAKSSTTLTFGVNFSSTSTYPALPEKFTLNGEELVIPEDHNPPTQPKDIETVSAGPTSIGLHWEESTDNETGVEGYEVRYKAANKGAEHTVFTTTNGIALGHLTASTRYDINITAKDYAGNTSASTTYHASTDAPLAGPARWQTGTQIKSSPFVDATSWPTPPIDQWSNDSGVDGYFLGFVTAALTSKSTGYTSKNAAEVKACWGGSLSIYDGNNQQSYDGDVTVSDYYKSYINNIREKGGDIILSFGGASNEPIEGPMTDIKKIVDIYLKTIANYSLTAIDFDFEGGFLAHNDALDRHISAITEVIKAKPTLKISYTLPVDGAPGLMGFNGNGEIFLKKLHDAGITPSLINGMSMEFGQGSSTNVFECARLSLEGASNPNPDGSQRGAIKQIKEIWTNLSDKEIYKLTGLCTMYAKHLNGKINTVENQAEINKYLVGAKGLGNVNGWDASIDKYPEKGGGGYEPYDYSKVVAAYEPGYDVLGHSDHHHHCH